MLNELSTMKKWLLKSKKDGQVFGPYLQEQVQKFLKERQAHDFLISGDGVTWRPCSNEKYLGKYELLEEVGRGGMGVVYRARDTQLNRECALKVLSIVNSGNKNVEVQRFFNEARAVAKIQHPYIVRIHEIYTQPRYFFAMDYIEGLPLNKFIHSNSMSLNSKLKLFIKICEAIEFAHGTNILHRDLKPSNVLVCQNPDPYPVVLDFGIAKHIEGVDDLTKTGEIFGTPKYMAPEAANAEILDARSDVYSLGVMLYEILTGHVPFNVDSFVALVYQIAVEDPVPPSRLNSDIDKNSSLEIVCLKALEKNREKRIQDVSFFKTELENILQNRAILSKAPSKWQKFSKWYKRNYLLATFLTSLLVVLIASSSVFLILWNRAHRENLRMEKHNLLIAKQKESIIKEKDFIQRRLLESRLNSFVEKLPQEDVITSLRSLKKMYFMFDEMISDKKTIDEELRSQYRLLANRFKFLSATRLPKKRTVRFQNKNGSGIFSGDQQRLAQRIKDRIYVWNVNDTKKFSPKNALANVKISVTNSSFFLSHSGRFVCYSGSAENGGHELFVYDFENKHHVFRGQGGLHTVHLCKDERTLIFAVDEFFHVYDLQKQQRIHSFLIPGKKIRVLFSNNDRWMGVVCSDTLFVCDLQKYKQYTQYEKLFRSPLRMVFSTDYKHLYVFTFFNIVVYNLSLQTMRILPVRQVNLEFSIAPVATNDAHIFLADKNGALISVYHKDFTSAAVYEKMPQLISRKVSSIQFCAPDLIAVAKGNILQIRDTHTFKVVYNIVEDDHIQTFKLKRTVQGLEIKTITKEKFCHYIYSIKEKQLPDEQKIMAQKLLKNMPFVAEIGRKILICEKKQALIYPNLFGFASWKDSGEFFFRRATYQHPFDFKCSDNEEFLAISIAPNRLKLYETTEFEMHSENFVASRMDKLTFSLDNKFIFLGGQRGEIGHFDILQRKFTMIGNINFTCQAMATLDKGRFIVTTTQGRIDVGGFSLCHYQDGKFSYKQFNKIEHALIPAVDVNRKEQIFALGDSYGRFSIWRGFEDPQLDFSGEITGQIFGISISEDSEYIAIFTLHSIYIYDRKVGETYPVYSGHRKFGTSNFSLDWKKAYFGSSDGGIHVVDQSYFFDQLQLKKKVDDCDVLLEDDSSWWRLIEKIENKIGR